MCSSDLCLSGLSTGLVMLIDLMLRERPVSGAVLIFGSVFNTGAIAGVRFLWRLIKTMLVMSASRSESNDTPMLIVGAGNAGA